MMILEERPCKDCLMIPVCRNRYWEDVLNKCELISKYLNRTYIDREPRVFGHKVPIHEIKMTFSLSQWQDRIMVSATHDFPVQFKNITDKT